LIEIISSLTGFYKNPRREKKILPFIFRQPFRGPDGINQVVKNASKQTPLAAIGRGDFHPYFHKPG
jgi:hypothetical protein